MRIGWARRRPCEAKTHVWQYDMYSVADGDKRKGGYYSAAIGTWPGIGPGQRWGNNEAAVF